ncbi:MAG: M42 family metallopeptidase [Candidatus Pacebacteria bacterium]|nr:M42 family metallopeptidase [Candidatus Paceibacterota bacterium]
MTKKTVKRSVSNNLEEIKLLLEKLSNAHGISGHEKEIRSILEEEIKPFVDEIKTDKLGNLIATKNGEGPSVMIAAHMDEIGFMVKYIDDDGFIYFAKSGGWFDQTLLNQRVIIHAKNKHIVGVVGSKPPHIMKAEEMKKIIEIGEMYLDIGAKNKKDVEKIGVQVGDTITLDRKFESLSNNMVTGKAFDNRAGIVMMIEAARILSKSKVKARIHFVGTVQEEVGLKGARTSAYSLNPDVAIATDVSITGDHPGVEKKHSSLEIGSGPSITVSDAEGVGIVVAESVLNWMKDSAKKERIPYQLSVTEGGMTDAAIINMTKHGIPSGGICVATRYIHSPVEVLDLKDLEQCAELIVGCVRSAHKYF